jgi:putative transposase
MKDRQPSGAVSHRFWQRGGGYDRNLRSDRDIYEKIRYVHLNPVRRGLAKDAGDWPWSSARTHETGKPEPISLNLESLPPPPLS